MTKEKAPRRGPSKAFANDKLERVMGALRKKPIEQMSAAEFDAMTTDYFEYLAADHRKAMQGMTEAQVETYIRGVIEAATGAVIGFYPQGPVTGLCLIKKVREDEFVAIPFTDKAQAIAARDTWGDGPPRATMH